MSGVLVATYRELLDDAADMLHLRFSSHGPGNGVMDAATTDCWYCGEPWPCESEQWKRRFDALPAVDGSRWLTAENEAERLRVLLAEGVNLTKDMNWSDVGDDWWGRAYDAVQP